MRILAFDTSTPAASVALLMDGALVVETTTNVHVPHGTTLLSSIAAVLDSAETTPAAVDLIAVGRGPGTFTGVRVALATAQGLALARGTPVVALPSSGALAKGAGVLNQAVAVVTAAQPRTVGVTVYEPGGDDGLVERVSLFVDSDDRAIARVREALDGSPFAVCGNGCRRWSASQRAALGPSATVLPAIHDTPRAFFIGVLGRALFERDGASDIATLEPLYLSSGY